MNIEKYVVEFSNEMQRKGYREESRKNYLSCIKLFLDYFKDRAKPTEINEKDIKEYLRKFEKHNTQRANHSAIKCFYKYVVKQPNKFKYIEYCKKDNRLPIVLSQEEVESIINSCENLKHKTILCLMYSTGIRVGEVINLKIEDIDSKRMVINIRDAKGGKDRQTMLDQNLLLMLRKYYTEYKPKVYLFNGQTDIQYSERSIAQFLQKYADLAGIKKRVYPHLIRHCSFTHMVEQGTDINLIQKLAGHSSVKTTAIYTHISHNIVSKIKSPLSNINLNRNQNENNINPNFAYRPFGNPIARQENLQAQV